MKSKEKILLEEIRTMQRELDGRIQSREDLKDCQKLSEKLDSRIAEYQSLKNLQKKDRK